MQYLTVKAISGKGTTFEQTVLAKDKQGNSNLKLSKYKGQKLVFTATNGNGLKITKSYTVSDNSEISNYPSTYIGCDGCDTGCGVHCANLCSGVCGGSCSGKCKTGCYGCTGGCTDGCTSCTDYCSEQCGGNCSGGCSNGCNGGCTSCGSICSPGCGGSCQTGCSGKCTSSCGRMTNAGVGGGTSPKYP